MMQRPLTHKEQKVVDVFEAYRPELGITVRQNILSPITGWAESIADMDEADIPDQPQTGFSRNSFMYRRIGS
ncbi:MAG: hypothetical protein F6K14_15650 [Symploca sp. SIO2C1]|nr:hypothetical protein [Symploca sp. SIO2C1]